MQNVPFKPDFQTKGVRYSRCSSRMVSIDFRLQSENECWLSQGLFLDAHYIARRVTCRFCARESAYSLEAALEPQVSTGGAFLHADMSLR